MLRIDSWHGRLATFYGPLDDYRLELDGTDICTYVRAVLRGGFWASLLTIVACFVAACFGDFCAWLLVGIMHTFVDINPLGGLFGATLFVVVCFALAIGAIIAVGELWAYLIRRSKKAPKSPPGFVKQAYSSWKDKYCFWLEFTK